MGGYFHTFSPVPSPQRASARARNRAQHFADHQAITEHLAGLTQVPLETEPSVPIIRLMELDEDLPNGAVDKKATPLYWITGTKTFGRIEAHQKTNVCNPYSSANYSSGDRLVLLYLPQAIKWVPISVPNALVASYPAIWGKLESELLPNGSALIVKYLADGTTTSNETERVWAPPLLTTGSIAETRWVRAEYDEPTGRYVVVSAEC